MMIMDLQEPPSFTPTWLTEEHVMLLRMRYALYEGSWEDFIVDLTARAADRPHVFDIVPPSEQVRSTIESHLTMIGDMKTWETDTNTQLRLD